MLSSLRSVGTVGEELPVVGRERPQSRFTFMAKQLSSGEAPAGSPWWAQLLWKFGLGTAMSVALVAAMIHQNMSLPETLTKQVTSLETAIRGASEALRQQTAELASQERDRDRDALARLLDSQEATRRLLEEVLRKR